MTTSGTLLRESLVRLGMCAAGAVVVMAAGLEVHEFAGGGWAEHTGTALYAVLVYLLVVAVVTVLITGTVSMRAVAVAARLRPVTLAWVTWVLCWLVGFAQLTGVPAQWATHSALSSLALGTTFQPPLDLLWYVIGAAARCLHWTARRWCAGHTRTAVRRRSMAAGPPSAAEPGTVTTPQGSDVR